MWSKQREKRCKTVTRANRITLYCQPPVSVGRGGVGWDGKIRKGWPGRTAGDVPEMLNEISRVRSIGNAPPPPMGRFSLSFPSTFLHSSLALSRVLSFSFYLASSAYAFDLIRSCFCRQRYVGNVRALCTRSAVLSHAVFLVIIRWSGQVCQRHRRFPVRYPKPNWFSNQKHIFLPTTRALPSPF